MGDAVEGVSGELGFDLLDQFRQGRGKQKGTLRWVSPKGGRRKRVDFSHNDY
jgi:hypothetical protein